MISKFSFLFIKKNSNINKGVVLKVPKLLKTFPSLFLRKLKGISNKQINIITMSQYNEYSLC